MPAYDFQKQFVPMILDGSKPHTIRRRRKNNPTKVGDKLMLYTGMRTKQCKLIAVTECVNVVSILLVPEKKIIWISSNPIDIDESTMRPLSVKEMNELAHRDGFEDTLDFFEFFKRYKEEVLFDFEIIYWNTELMVSGNAGEIKLQLGEKPGICSLGYDMRKG